MSDLSPPRRKSVIERWFLAHPATANETYLQHMRFAFGFSFWLITAGLAALVHAVFPSLCETTASDILRKLVVRIEARH